MQSVTSYYDPPTTNYPSPGYLDTQTSTKKPSHKNYYPAASIYPSLSGMNDEKNKHQFGNSYQYDLVTYTTSTIKPIVQEAVWPSNQLPPPKKRQELRNTINDNGNNIFNENLDSKRRRKLKNRRNRAKRRRNRFFKTILKNSITGRKRKHLLPSITKYLKEKRRKLLLEDKIRRGIPYPNLPTAKPLPKHMEHSLLVLMPEGPRSPFFESIGKLTIFFDIIFNDDLVFISDVNPFSIN